MVLADFVEFAFLTKIPVVLKVSISNMEVAKRVPGLFLLRESFFMYQRRILNFGKIFNGDCFKNPKPGLRRPPGVVGWGE